MAQGTKRVREAQVLLNRYFNGKKLGFAPLRVDGKLGKITKRRIQWARYFMGVGPNNVAHQSHTITEEFTKTLRRPRRRLRGYDRKAHKARIKTVHKRQAQRREALKRKKQQGAFGSAAGWPHWGGSAHVILLTVPVAKRYGAPLTSAKRPANHPLSRSNPGSDHNMANVYAYAHDYAAYGAAGVRLAYATASQLGLGGYRTGSYTAYRKTLHGIAFAVQGLWAVQGHYDHNHWGAHRA